MSATLTAVATGLLATIQDLGRPGHAHLGVSTCGAADPFSLRLGNRLVGNPDGTAAVEMTLTGCAWRVDAPSRCVLAGADMAAVLDPGGQSVPPWTPFTLGSRETLRLGAARTGARTYLCVAGGVAVPPVLGSRATHLPSGLGGLDGRALRAGDRMPLADPQRPGTAGVPPPDAATVAGVLFRRALRVTAGPEAELFAPEALEGLELAVSERSDRLGLRLAGPPIVARTLRELLTGGAPWGSVQVPPGGEAIVLGVDAGTTGGYPRIAAVVAADLPALGQLRPRDRVRFERVDLATARQLLAARERLLDTLAPRVAE